MIHDIINRIKSDLVSTFAEIHGWFTIDSSLLDYSPQNGGWTVRQILEHISLTNYYLLILIRKGTNKAVVKAKKEGVLNIPAGYNLDWNKLISIGEHNSFKWTRPEHMEPTGQLTMNEVKEKLDNQLH
ncbi:MAG: DinB family protein, partial [Bacteroidota bacterium]